jgi:hypothetical protein
VLVTSAHPPIVTGSAASASPKAAAPFVAATLPSNNKNAEPQPALAPSDTTDSLSSPPLAIRSDSRDQLLKEN